MDQHQATVNVRMATTSLLIHKLGSPQERRVQLAAYLLQEPWAYPRATSTGCTTTSP